MGWLFYVIIGGFGTVLLFHSLLLIALNKKEIKLEKQIQQMLEHKENVKKRKPEKKMGTQFSSTNSGRRSRRRE